MAHINPIKNQIHNDPLLYINKSSNHSPQIVNHLPRISSDRSSRNSSNKEVFNPSKGESEQALKRSGFSNFRLPSSTRAQVM